MSYKQFCDNCNEELTTYYVLMTEVRGPSAYPGRHPTVCGDFCSSKCLLEYIDSNKNVFVF